MVWMLAIVSLVVIIAATSFLRGNDGIDRPATNEAQVASRNLLWDR